MSRSYRNQRSEIFRPGGPPLNYGDVQMTFDDFSLLAWVGLIFNFPDLAIRSQIILRLGK